MFGYAGGHRSESPPDQPDILLFDTASELPHRPTDFATHNDWSVKLIQFRQAWKPKNKHSYTSTASKLNVVTVPSEVSGAETS